MAMTCDRLPMVLISARSWICALRLEDAIEIMRPLPIQSVTGAPRFVRGLAIVRGTLLPVLDLAVLLGAGASDVRGRFLVVRAGIRQIVLAVDEFVGVSWIDLSLLANVPPLLNDALPEDLQKLGTHDSHVLAVLQAGRLVSDDTWQALAAQGVQ